MVLNITPAATCSGGNPEVGNRLAELLVPNMDEKIDPTMMAALMSACSLINAGAGTEEVKPSPGLRAAALLLCDLKNKFLTITKFQPIESGLYFCSCNSLNCKNKYNL